MLNYHFKNNEEKLRHIIDTNNSSYEEYEEAVEQIQNIDYTDINDRGFLHKAVGNNKPDIALDLMKRGIDVNLQDVGGSTAAMFMATHEQWDLLEKLLEYHPNVNLKDWRYGNSLLWDVVFHSKGKHNDLAKKLLKMGANPYSKNHSGRSPLDLAIALSNQELETEFRNTAEPQEDEEEVFHVPRKASGIFPIKIRDYQKYICVEGVSVPYLENKIYSYSEICDGKKRKYKIKLIPVKDSNWTILSCPDNMDFYNYHNLMSWFWGISEDTEIPKQNICIALHKEDERLSYYGIIEDLTYGDRLVGRFQNRESFSIYLPEAYKKGGNAKSYADVLPIKSISRYLDTCGFEENWLEESTNMPYKEITVELVID